MPFNLASGIFNFERKQIPAKHRLLAEMRGKWEEVVGETNARHSSPRAIRGDELIVHVDDPMWVSTLQFLKDDILENLGKHFAQDARETALKTVRFRVGELAPKAEKAPRVKFAADPEQEKRVKEAVADVEDPELREALKAFLIRKKRVEE